MRMYSSHWRGELATGTDWYGHGGDEVRLREPIAPQRSIYPSRRVVWSQDLGTWIEALPGRGASAYISGLVDVWNSSRPVMRLGQEQQDETLLMQERERKARRNLEERLHQIEEDKQRERRRRTFPTRAAASVVAPVPYYFARRFKLFGTSELGQNGAPTPDYSGGSGSSIPGISDLDVSDLGDLAGNIADLINKIPTSNPKYAALKEKLIGCLDTLEKGDAYSLYKGGKCLYDLYKEAKDASDEEAKKPSPITVMPPSTGIGMGTLALLAAAGIGLFVVLK